MGKESISNAEDTGDAGSILCSKRSPEGINGNPLQYFCLENSMDRGSWQATVQGVAKSWTQLSMWHRLYCVCLSRSSVIIKCMYVQSTFEPLMGSQLPKVTWGHSCASRAQVPELEKSLWLFCIISMSSPGPHQSESGVEFRDQLESFLPPPPHAAYINCFLPKNIYKIMW